MMCRNSAAICNVKCSNMGRKRCTRNTQEFKARMQECFGKKKKLVRLGRNMVGIRVMRQTLCNSVLQHSPSPKTQCGGITGTIVWQGNPIGAVKHLLRKTATCARKKNTAILTQSRCNLQLLIKSNNKICSGCRQV